MLNRRDFLLASLATLCIPGRVTAGMRVERPLSWTDYLREVKQLAQDHYTNSHGSTWRAAIAATGYN